MNQEETEKKLILEEVERRQSLVSQDFFNQMIFELEQNKNKGVWLFWEDIEEIKDEINHHWKKLKSAEVLKDLELIKEHIADVSNLLMMLGNAYNVYKRNDEDETGL